MTHSLGSADTAGVSPSSDPPNASIARIDWARAAELRDEVGAEDFYEIVTLFLSEVQRTLDALPRQPAELPDLAERLHFLKGSSLNLGFAQMAALCQQGEDAAAAGRAGSVDLAALHACFRHSRKEFLVELAARLAA